MNLEVTHNTDLDPAPDYLASAPRARVALQYPELLQKFAHYEEIANAQQRRFHRLGIASLVLAAISLTGVLTEWTLALVFEVHLPGYVTASLELTVIGSIILALLPHLLGTRTKWLCARFMTEQMRLWHFQSWLDGELVSRAITNPEEFASERARRWARFTASVACVPGHMSSFVEEESDQLFHPVHPYTTPAVADEIMRAYVDLRIDKQMAYFKLKQEHFQELDDGTELLARILLFLALVCTAIQLALVLVNVYSPDTSLHSRAVIIFAVAVGLVIFSAVVRVYRDALAISPERERYEAKWVRLVALRAAYGSATSIAAKQEVMKELEIMETRELRGFLQAMRRTSYIL